MLSSRRAKRYSFGFVYIQEEDMKKRLEIQTSLLVIGMLLLFLTTAYAQNPLDEEKIWESFKTWILANPPQPSLKAYGEKLSVDGMSQEGVKSQLETIRRLLKEHPEKGVELTYDHIFSKPLTGDPEKDGFTSTPSVFMMESVKDLEPGKALDVGAGQGRNAVWLARKGWDVTAIDISGVGLAVAASDAEKAGTRITTVKTTYQDFEFGAGQWDLIVMILSWAPVSDPDFVTRLHTSLRPGGVLVFEHFLETEKQSFPPYVHGLPPNALLAHFKDFHIQKYEEGVWLGDWGGPPADLVRMIARKK
jgi:2-polyprenyl-3-methyl-5-hydroxy-6-metoxy-1,4-benzoquinol methylase